MTALFFRGLRTSFSGSAGFSIFRTLFWCWCFHHWLFRFWTCGFAAVALRWTTMLPILQCMEAHLATTVITFDTLLQVLLGCCAGTFGGFSRHFNWLLFKWFLWLKNFFLFRHFVITNIFYVSRWEVSKVTQKLRLEPFRSCTTPRESRRLKSIFVMSVRGSVVYRCGRYKDSA